MKWVGKEFHRPMRGHGPRSLGDAAGGALVDAGAAVDALGGVNDGDVLDGQGALRADVDASSAGHALGSVNGNCHCYYLEVAQT